MSLDKTPTKTHGFDVTVQQVIGTVKLGPGGTDDPMVAAFKIIGEHFSTEPAGEPRLYAFPGPDDGETVRINAQIMREDDA